MHHHQPTYATGSVFRHISNLSITSAVGLFAIFFVDLVDVLFISMLGEAELAAAVGFAGVGLFLGAAVCIGVSIGISTLVAQALGAEDEETARRFTTHGLIYSLFWTVPTTLLTLYFAPELLSLAGAEGRTLDLAVGYFRIVGASLPILGFAIASTALLRSSGDPKLSMWSTLNGGLVNAVLDPIFIFALDLGLTGAALASVLSRLTVAAVALYGVVIKHDLLSSIDVRHIRKDFAQLSSLTIPSLITNLSGPIGSAYATAQMAKFGTEAVAAAAVVGRISPVAFAGLYGLSGAVGPIASQNVGASQFHRVSETLQASAKFSALYVIPVAILLFVLQGYLTTWFNLDGEAAALLAFYCNFIVISYLLFALQLAANPVFVALRHPGFATVSNLSRDLVLAIPLIALFSAGFGARGVLGGQALANALAGILSFWFALWLTRRTEKGESITLPFLHNIVHHYRHVAPGVQHRGH